MTATADPAVDAGASTDAAVTIRDLHVTVEAGRDRIHVLRGVDLQVQPGEILALVGESGSGKSVLVRAILGLLPQAAKVHHEGSVRVGGQDMLAGTAGDVRLVRRSLLGAVFQDPLHSLDPTQKIGKQVRERGETRERAVANLREAGVGDPDGRMGQFPHQLSGGLRQRVMIAAALGPSDAEGTRDGPAVLVADEPTTALDVSVQAQILQLFDRLRRRHRCAIVFVTHDLRVAASLADRIAVMYAGRLCEVGPTADVLRRPLHRYTEMLLESRRAIDDIDVPKVDLRGQPPDPREPLPGCAFAPRCAHAQDDCRTGAAVDLMPAGAARAHACLHPAAGPPAVLTRATPPGPPAIGRADVAPVLTLDGVSKAFRLARPRIGAPRTSVQAVTDLSLSVPRGGSVAVVGESGCGKSTMLRLASKLVEPDSGTVTWDDGNRPPQLVYQDPRSSLTPWLTIEEQLTERLRGLSASARRLRAREMLDRVGLDTRLAAARPRAMSGGQQQRAAIARALVNEPQLLLCDEPVSALDASLASRILALLTGLRADLGLALLFVTHDLGVARYVADDIAVMYLGRVVEIGPSATVLGRAGHPYTVGLLAAAPTSEPGMLAPSLSGEPPRPTAIPPGCAFAARCPLVVDRCRVERPELRPISSGARVACHVAE